MQHAILFVAGSEELILRSFPIVILLVTLVFAVSGATPVSRRQSQAQPPSAASAVASQGQETSTDSLEFLLTSSATDFQAHRPPVVDRFRNVRFGHIVTDAGKKRSLLCGELLPQKQADKAAEWIPFVTIQTGNTVYEQWLGAQAMSFCQPPKFVRDDDKDFSSSLQKRLDSMR